MRLHQIGELRLLQKIREKFSVRGSGVVAGIGDDSAVIAPSADNIIVTTDMMNEGVHFDLSYCSPYHIGFKLVAVNVSDIMAMGGKPAYLFLDIAVKPDTDEQWFEDLYEGISASMDIYGVKLLGGDLCSAKNDMSFAATAIGFGKKVIRRSGASIGDKIYVTGNLGDSACGLALLQRLNDESKSIIRSSRLEIASEGKRRSEEEYLSLTHDSKLIILNRHTVEPLLSRHLMPVARDSSEIAKAATAMIDLSDGLFLDMNRICDESNCGAKIYLDRLPLSDAIKNVSSMLGLNALELAASGGEDYELLFTSPSDIQIPDLKITCIGEVTERQRVVIDGGGREFPLEAKGYEHF